MIGQCKFALACNVMMPQSQQPCLHCELSGELGQEGFPEGMLPPEWQPVGKNGAAKLVSDIVESRPPVHLEQIFALEHMELPCCPVAEIFQGFVFQGAFTAAVLRPNTFARCMSQDSKCAVW